MSKALKKRKYSRKGRDKFREYSRRAKKITFAGIFFLTYFNNLYIREK